MSLLLSPIVQAKAMIGVTMISFKSSPHDRHKKESKMDYKQLGDTGVQIPEIGLGTWAYTGGVEPLRRGVELGAFLIDTAESYGTEEAVGQALQGIRDQVFLATKVSREHFRRADLLKAADQSLKRLGIDHIDLYQLHFPNFSIPVEETMGGMESLVEAGKVRFIGVSNFSVEQMKQAQAALSKDRIVSNQVKYSLIARDIEADVLPFCQENQVTVIAYSPLAKGLDHIARKDRDRIIGQVAAMAGKTEAQVALNWCIAEDNVIAIPKANSVAHVEENCGASGWRLASEHLDLLDTSFR